MVGGCTGQTHFMVGPGRGPTNTLSTKNLQSGLNVVGSSGNFLLRAIIRGFCFRVILCLKPYYVGRCMFLDS